MIIEALTLLFLIFTSLFGIISLIQILAVHIFERNVRENAVLLLPVKGHEERIEWMVRNLLAERERRRVGILDLGMDKETREIAERLTKSSPVLSLLEQDGVLDFLNHESEQNG